MVGGAEKAGAPPAENHVSERRPPAASTKCPPPPPPPVASSSSSSSRRLSATRRSCNNMAIIVGLLTLPPSLTTLLTVTISSLLFSLYRWMDALFLLLLLPRNEHLGVLYIVGHRRLYSIYPSFSLLASTCAQIRQLSLFLFYGRPCPCTLCLATTTSDSTLGSKHSSLMHDSMHGPRGTAHRHNFGCPTRRWLKNGVGGSTYVFLIPCTWTITGPVVIIVLD